MLLDSPIISNYSRKLPRLQVASLTSWWYLHFLLISGGFGAFKIYSTCRLVLDVFSYRLRHLPIANYSYKESNPPLCRYKIVAQDSSPDLDLTGNELRAVIFCHYSCIMFGACACLLFSKLCWNSKVAVKSSHGMERNSDKHMLTRSYVTSEWLMNSSFERAKIAVLRGGDILDCTLYISSDGENQASLWAFIARNSCLDNEDWQRARPQMFEFTGISSKVLCGNA